ncbi:MAG TPA: VOC family protein [Ktedonobacterales bacterium]|jgi:catechol 2,3-dioxygenase-like lactoylglutathione lyase family enzyme
MPTRIDHVIIACEDLAAAEAAFTRLGFFTAGGGTHPLLGTRNRVTALGEGYLELVAVADPTAVSPALRERIAWRAGYIGYAAQSADIEREAAAIRARGMDVRGPRAGAACGAAHRARWDGARLAHRAGGG